jgi:F0F1-type ATP synthase delta subunit
MPKTSQLMDHTIELNKLNLLHEADRKHLQQFLQAVQDKAPLLHISFSADPSVAFLEKLIAWLRQEIHPLVLVTVGLQPNIGAGCIVRSINRQFDCSLRKDFATKRELLQEALVPEAQPAKVTP